MAKCTSCGAWIFFARTAAGKLMPIDARSVETGNLIVTNADGTPRATFAHVPPAAGEKRYRSHFASCPNRTQHRAAHRAAHRTSHRAPREPRKAPKE